MKKIPLTFFVLLFVATCFAQNENQAVPYTLADRDRMIKLETEITSLRNEINIKFEAVDAKFEARFDAIDTKFDAINTKFDSLDERMTQLFNFLWVLMAMFTVITATTLGFAFYDRKTANRPLKIQNKKIMDILNDYAENEPRLKEIINKNAAVF